MTSLVALVATSISRIAPPLQKTMLAPSGEKRGELPLVPRSVTAGGLEQRSFRIVLPSVGVRAEF